MNCTRDPTNLNEAVKVTKKERIGAFSLNILHTQPKAMLLGSNMQVMMQALKEGTGPCLPHGLSIIKPCTKMATGSEGGSCGEESDCCSDYHH